MLKNPNHNDFVGLYCYKCHLKGKAGFPAERDNPNNVLWMSWNLLQRFDGPNTIWQHQVPQIAFKFVSREGLKISFDNGLEKEKVVIEIECPEACIFEVVRLRMKDEMISDEQRKTLTT
mmetsp:Transcript_26137/g.36021  ORF Transcript_26137/g.36021 Transcript_26137/m.36021 type:complete len:119 (-) Transcript_26137:272-628(-)